MMHCLAVSVLAGCPAWAEQLGRSGLSTQEREQGVVWVRWFAVSVLAGQGPGQPRGNHLWLVRLGTSSAAWQDA